MEGESKEHAAEVEARCTEPGTRLRAPTADMGLAPLCTDSFFGEITVRFWRKNSSGQRIPESLVELKSSSGGPDPTCPKPPVVALSDFQNVQCHVAKPDHACRVILPLPGLSSVRVLQRSCG